MLAFSGMRIMSGELYGAVEVPTAQFPFDLAIFLLVALELFHLIHILQKVMAKINENNTAFLLVLFSAGR